MTNDVRQILAIIDQAYDRASWHGTNLHGSLRRVSVDQAAWRPNPQRHNIWEIVVHAAYWKYAVSRRFTGSPRGSFPLKGSNWFRRPPDKAGTTEKAWKADIELLAAMHGLLRAEAARVSSRDLGRTPRGSKVSNFAMLSGIAAHDLYHAGQIQLLKKLYSSGMRVMLAVLLIAALIFPAAANAQAQTPAAPQPKPVIKRLYVRAVDRAGAPVTGLTPDDFFVSEAGYERIVSRVMPADDPVRVVMLVDDSKMMSAAMPDVRKALLAFFDALPAPHEIGLVTIGGTPLVRQEPTAQREALKALPPKIAPNGSLTLVNAIFEMYGRFLKEPGRWPMFVILANDANDASPGVTQDNFAKAAEEMQANDTVVHAVMVSAASGSTGDSSQVARVLAKATGGTFESVSTAGALPQKLAALAKMIVEQHRLSAAQYIVEYDSDPTKPPEMPRVAPVREGIRLTLSQQGRIR